MSSSGWLMKSAGKQGADAESETLVMQLVRATGGRSALIILVVLGVLGAAAVLGVMVTPRLAMLLGLGIAGAIAWLWLTRALEWGILAIIPVSLLINWGLGTGTQTTLNLTILMIILVTGVWLARMLIMERKISLSASPVNLPALLLIFTGGLSLLAGNLPWVLRAGERASLFSQVGGYLMLILPLAALLVTGNNLKEEKWIRWLTTSFLGLGGIYLLSRLLPGGGQVANQFAAGGVGSPFWVWMSALGAALFLFGKGLPRWARWGGGLAAALALGLGVINRSWASGWLPSFVAIGVLVWLRSWRWGLLLTIASGILLIEYGSRISASILAVEEYSAITRVATWPIMAELFKASPLLGLGPSNYYFYTPLYSIMGYYIKFNSHNNYLDLLAQYGLLGLTMFGWLCVALVKIGLRLRRVHANGFVRAYANACLAGLAGMLASGLLGDWFIPFVYNIGFTGFRAAAIGWLLLGGMLALDQIMKPGERG